MVIFIPTPAKYTPIRLSCTCMAVLQCVSSDAESDLQILEKSCHSIYYWKVINNNLFYVM